MAENRATAPTSGPSDVGAPLFPRLPHQDLVFDIAAMRERASEDLANGVITDDYALDPAVVVSMLNAALASELVCVLRYKRHYFAADGIEAKSVSAEFLEHAQEEQGHADVLAKRIIELGGEPDFDPKSFEGRSHTRYFAGSGLRDMLEHDLIEERVGIESYRRMIRWFGDRDPTTRRLLEEILAVEEEHAEDLISLLRGF